MLIPSPHILRTPTPEEKWISEGIFVREILNHPDNPAFSIARCRLPIGHVTQLHCLDVDETYLIEQGSGRMQVGDEIFNVTAGDNIFIPKSIPQNITNIGEVDLIFQAICIPRFTMDGYTRWKPDKPSEQFK